MEKGRDFLVLRLKRGSRSNFEFFLQLRCRYNYEGWEEILHSHFTLSLQCPFRTGIYIIEKWKSYFSSEMNIQYIPHQQLNIAFLQSERVWIHVSPAHIFFKRIDLAIFFIIWLLDCKLFWIRYLNCTRRRNVRQETFFVYRVVHNWTPPVSSFGWIWAQLNPFRISIKFQPRISNLKICMETTAVEKILSPFSQALQPPKIAKHTISPFVETIIVVITKSATRVLKRWRQISFSVLTTSSIL